MNTNYYPNPSFPNANLNGVQMNSMKSVASQPSITTANQSNNKDRKSVV